MKSEEIVLGADPEVFVEKGNKELFNAFEFLRSKYDPEKTDDGNNFYWDGFQAEFNIHPSKDIPKCLASIKSGLTAVLKAAERKDPTARLSTQTVVDVSLDTLEKLPIDKTEFGCMPSFNIHQIAGISAAGHTVPYRFAGGHIHFGIGKHSEETLTNLVYALDTLLAVTCVSLFENLDNPIRRHYYGLAGEFRLPPHGLEYRVLSDAWIFHPKAANMVLDLARRIVAYVFAGGRWNADMGEVIETVLLCDTAKARSILERNLNCFEEMGFKTDINLFKPIEVSIPNMNDIAKNWNI